MSAQHVVFRRDFQVTSVALVCGADPECRTAPTDWCDASVHPNAGLAPALDPFQERQTSPLRTKVAVAFWVVLKGVFVIGALAAPVLALRHDYGLMSFCQTRKIRARVIAAVGHQDSRLFT